MMGMISVWIILTSRQICQIKTDSSTPITMVWTATIIMAISRMVAESTYQSPEKEFTIYGLSHLWIKPTWHRQFAYPDQRNPRKDGCFNHMHLADARQWNLQEQPQQLPNGKACG
jgi:hypothetical protein